MKLSKKDKMKIMEWAVELAKLEFKSQYNTLGDEAANIRRMLDEKKRYNDDDKKSPKPDMSTVVASIYKALLQTIECKSNDKAL